MAPQRRGRRDCVRPAAGAAPAGYQPALNYHLLRDPGRVQALVAAIHKYRLPQVSVDFETAAKDKEYGVQHGRLRLIQIGVDHPAFKGARQYLIDCDHVDPRLLRPLFSSWHPEKLIHWSHFEQTWAHVHLGCPIQNVYDTGFAMQSINKELGRWLEDPEKGRAAVDLIIPDWEWHRASLDVAAEKLLGIVLPKDPQSSNWNPPELTEEQLAYAARDVAVLPAVAERVKRLAAAMEISGRIAFRCRKAREEAAEEWTEERAAQARAGGDGSRELCWELVYAEDPAQLDEIWDRARQLPLGAINREELEQFYGSRREEFFSIAA